MLYQKFLVVKMFFFAEYEYRNSLGAIRDGHNNSYTGPRKQEYKFHLKNW